MAAGQGQPVFGRDGTGHGVAGNHLGHRGAGGFNITIQCCRLGQQALAHIVAWRFLGDLVEHFLGLGMLALGHADGGFKVGGVEEVGRAANRPINLLAGLGQAVLLVQGAGNTGAGPRKIVAFQNVAIRDFSGVRVAAGEQYFGLLAEDFKAVGPTAFTVALLLKQGNGQAEFLFTLLLVIVGKKVFLGNDALQAQQQFVR